MLDWQSRSISTLEYLMWLNIYSGRSFNDLTQYPVFPWLVQNYEKNEINAKEDYRDLGLCMGMLSISEKGEARKETFCDTYELVKNDLKEMFPDFNYSEFLKKQDEYYESYRKKKKEKKKKDDENKLDVNHLPYFYGSHYSNPTYISHYLSRSFPSAFVAIEIQGEKFDDPDRLFFSMNKTFISASSLKDDVRELIPEFYITPEIFINQNNLNLSQGKISFDNKKYEINDVELPPWSNNNACKFVCKIRRILESNDIKMLNKWIDLIFGSAQRGEKAEENKNIFKAQSYERMVKIYDITDPDSRNALMRLIEIGVTPLQIFSADSKPKFDKKQFLEKSSIYLNAKGNFIFEEKDWITKIIKLNNFKNIKKKLYNNEKYSKNKIYTLDKDDYSNIKIVKMKQIENNNIRIFTNTNIWFNVKIYPKEKDLSHEESSIYDIENNSNKFANSFLLNNISFPLVIYDNWKYLLKGGFMDGRIEFNILINDQKEELISNTIFNDLGCITLMEMSEKENYLLCGTNNGNLLYFYIDKKKLDLKNNILIHTKPIISISINDNLNMFATTSKDGYIMLYTVPKINSIRSIYVPSLFKDEKEFLWADNIFLSNYPLPCFAIYISKKKIFKTFTINGHYMEDIKEDENTENIKCGTVFTSFNYQDYLIYGTNDGFIKLRKFPELDLIHKINPFKGKSIECLCLSKDSRFIFCWSDSNEIAVISNNFAK
jgi:WD40 repeat protein